VGRYVVGRKWMFNGVKLSGWLDVEAIVHVDNIGTHLRLRCVAVRHQTCSTRILRSDYHLVLIPRHLKPSP